MARPWETSDRLPNDVLPLHYDVMLFPDLKNDTFIGQVTIQVQSTAPRNFFVVHVKHLNVVRTVLSSSDDGIPVRIAEAFNYELHEFWVVRTEERLPAGTYSLFLEFDGRLDNGIVGFYKSVYVDGRTGKRRSVATSKFQPTYARRAFPCFDEPSFKSTFKTVLVRPSDGGYVALSNMPEESRKEECPSEGFTQVTFQTSLPMVTYLAVFMVCDFVHIESTTPSGGGKIPMRIYGTAHNQPHLRYAANAGSAIAGYYDSTYFDIRYPLPKLDMAAVPDYSSGATEHWGLITYRETNLVYVPGDSSLSNKIRIAEVVAHELAHQWFGNLVSVSWWNDLWLNEGFATYLAYKGVKSYETDWDVESMFLIDDLHPVMKLDATFSSRPIVTDVNTPDQITAVFDIVSYSKGAAVIRMMDNFLGSPDFRKGLRNFLLKHSYKTAVTKDLLDELSAASSEGLDVNKIMNSWTRQKGYPVMTVKRYGDRYRIIQERFLTVGGGKGMLDDDVVSPYGYRWEVPVTYITSSDPHKVNQRWFHMEDEYMDVQVAKGISWVKFNVDQLGYYRVNYSTQDWLAFGNLLKNNATALSVGDRTSLLNDSFSLAAGGRLPYSVPLSLTSYLMHERSLAPWQTALDELNGLDRVLYYSDVYPLYDKFLIDLLQPIHAELGWENQHQDSTFDATLLRPTIINNLCDRGDVCCLKTAGHRFAEWLNDGTVISPDMRNAIYSNGLKAVGGNWKVWSTVLERYRIETSAQEKAKLLRALASVRVPWIVRHLVQLAKDESVVRGQDFFTALTYLARNRVANPIIWDFYRIEWKYLVDRFTLNDRIFGRFITILTQTFSTQLRLDEMKDFFRMHPDAGAGERYRKIALETVANNIRFLQNHLPEIATWLQHNVKTD